MNEQLKFLILLFYYERPEIVKDALESIAASHYKNYEVAFIDDSEDCKPGEGVYRQFLYKEGSSNLYCHTEDTQEAKLARGGSMFGAAANAIMLASAADVVIPLCDDDRLTPWYLGQLNKFYTNNPEVMYSYCDVITFDPSKEDWKDKLTEPASPHFLNANHNPHPGGNSKDSSQMSFRMTCIKEGGARWVAPLTACLDFHMWNSLNSLYGPAVWNGVVGQVKAYWAKQLGGRGTTYTNAE